MLAARCKWPEQANRARPVPRGIPAPRATAEHALGLRESITRRYDDLARELLVEQPARHGSCTGNCWGKPSLGAGFPGSGSVRFFVVRRDKPA
jgi:hypothetical protein